MMKRSSLIALSLLFVSLRGIGSQATDSPESTFHVWGEVKLLQAGSGASIKDESKAVVWLVPEGQVRPVRLQAPEKKYRMVQRNKAFEPSLLVVPLGSVVEFPNLDPWFHNVFSLYQGKRFDLGLYEAGTQKTIRFDRPGPSYIFCNIHPEMAAVVLTVNSDFYGVSDKSGRISIEGVPKGNYLLHVWYENSDQGALDSLQRPVEVDRGNETLFTISVPVSPQKSTKHKNKYGKDYDPKAGSTDY